jgi:hypothetical protein
VHPGGLISLCQDEAMKHGTSAVLTNLLELLTRRQDITMRMHPCLRQCITLWVLIFGALTRATAEISVKKAKVMEGVDPKPEFSHQMNIKTDDLPVDHVSGPGMVLSVMVLITAMSFETYVFCMFQRA